MKPAIRALWTAALRSGDYQQGQGRLRGMDQFCCLGVLCDLAAKHGLGTWDGSAFKANEFHLVATVLPPPIADWAGLEELDPCIGKLGISMYNDGSEIGHIKPHIFVEIADLIEEHL